MGSPNTSVLKGVEPFTRQRRAVYLSKARGWQVNDLRFTRTIHRRSLTVLDMSKRLTEEGNAFIYYLSLKQVFYKRPKCVCPGRTSHIESGFRRIEVIQLTVSILLLWGCQSQPRQRQGSGIPTSSRDSADDPVMSGIDLAVDTIKKPQIRSILKSEINKGKSFKR
jgi:hypothetical protein